jgi:hypothetical protein
MQRKTFIKTLLGASTMFTLGTFQQMTESLTTGDDRLQGEKDTISFFNDKLVGGSLNMTSVLISNT